MAYCLTIEYMVHDPPLVYTDESDYQTIRMA